MHRLILKPDSHRHVIPNTVTSVIVKQEKDGWEEEFEVEKIAYKKLEQLQGEVIPYLYGQGSFNGLPALILSDIDGITLDDLARRSNDEVSEEELKTYLEEVFKKLSKHGVLYRDQGTWRVWRVSRGLLMAGAGDGRGRGAEAEHAAA